MEKRAVYQKVRDRIEEPRKFIQVLLGPRQVGKTTLVHQVSKELEIPSYYATADTATLEDLGWLATQWEVARHKAAGKEALLIIDEVQKIPNWSSLVKKLWDEDSREGLALKVVLLGSSPWLMQKGLSESLAGRFEVIPITHWSFVEMEQMFNFDLDHYIYFGGYPGPADLVRDEKRWRNYINDALIETTISRDIILMTQVNKPVLLRRLFQLGCTYSGQILSFQKMLGQLQDAGNTTTLAHYLSLLQGAGLMRGLEKYTLKSIKARGSSPKFQVYNTALMSAMGALTFAGAKKDTKYWGRLVESAVGAHLVNSARESSIEIFYWRDGDHEVDFVLKRGEEFIPIEVKSASMSNCSGLVHFEKRYKIKRQLLIGGDGIPVEEFLRLPVEHWF